MSSIRRPVARLHPIKTLACLVAGALAAASHANAQSAEEEELTFEQRIIHNILGGGSDSGIDYRERSPLVIPPAANLPPPAAGSGAEKTAAWPKDPDVARKRKTTRSANTHAIDAVAEGERNLRPDELKQGKIARANNDPIYTGSVETAGAPIAPSELGGKQLHQWFGLGGGNREKIEAAPTERPTRSRLTQPPSDYRMAVPNQPYAPPKESGTSWFRAINPFDRGTCEQGGC
ncbi:MAG: hypothetical protein QOD74_1879 [Variibacter sp.]|jgi:hypothetical protein|nr:hypothetical protein [Variibacter sp.]